MATVDGVPFSLEKNGVEDSMLLLALPEHCLLIILQRLDRPSLCAVARTSVVLNRLAAHPALWPEHDAGAEGCAAWDVRCVLARVLRLPPQAFAVQLDAARSRRFPVTVPLFNLRPLLGVSDTEGLAERTSKALQECAAACADRLWRCKSWQEFPHAASVAVCRADRAAVRMALRPEAVVPRAIHRLQQAGWPPAHPVHCGAAVCSAGSTHCLELLHALNEHSSAAAAMAACTQVGAVVSALVPAALHQLALHVHACCSGVYVDASVHSQTCIISMQAYNLVMFTAMLLCHHCMIVTHVLLHMPILDNQSPPSCLPSSHTTSIGLLQTPMYFLQNSPVFNPRITFH
jgi:F-box domain